MLEKIKSQLKTLNSPLRLGLAIIIGLSAGYLLAQVPVPGQVMPLKSRTVFGLTPFVLTNTATDTATLTPGQMSSLLTGTPTAAANYTTPTATQLCQLFPFVGAQNSQGFYYPWFVKNTSGGANTITVVAGSGVTVTGTATIAQNNVKEFMVVLDTCVGTPAAHIISLGTSVF